MTFAEAKPWLGWIIALVIFLTVVILKVTVGFPLEWALAIAAICAVRL